MIEQMPVYILAGGKSSRFGSDKAMIEIEGQPLITRIAEALKPRASRITVVADVEGKYARLGLRTIADRIAGLGPVGGLLTAVEDCDSDGWLLLASCDLVEVDAAWVDPLMAGRNGTAVAVAFKAERWEPLFAIYHTRIHQQLRASAESQERSLWRLIEAVCGVAVAPPADWQGLRQINTREDLRRHIRSNA
jgi:molybdopterin-guanine dinucleotide biosynthesis protein A